MTQPWLSLLTLEDCIEIALFILAFRLISTVLYAQKDKRTLLGWYAYSGTLLGAYTLSLHAIMFLIVTLLPALIVLGIVLHEKRVQQALVPYERMDALAAVGAQGSWIDELMSFLLQRINQCYDVHVLVEHRHTLSTCLTTETRLDARFSKKTLELLLTSYHKEDIVWLATQPSIISHTAHWRESHTNFLEQAAHISTTLDCLAIRACSTTRRFTIAVQGKIIENLSAHHALNLLHELRGTRHATQTKGSNHDSYTHQEPTQRSSDTYMP